MRAKPAGILRFRSFAELSNNNIYIVITIVHKTDANPQFEFGNELFLIVVEAYAITLPDLMISLCAI